MTFQYACRKLQRSKDLEPAGPAKLFPEGRNRGSRLTNNQYPIINKKGDSGERKSAQHGIRKGSP